TRPQVNELLLAQASGFPRMYRIGRKSTPESSLHLSVSHIIMRSSVDRLPLPSLARAPGMLMPTPGNSHATNRASITARRCAGEVALSDNRALEMFLAACGADVPLELTVSGRRGGTPEQVVLDRPFALIGSDRRCEIRLRATGVAPRQFYLQRIAG